MIRWVIRPIYISRISIKIESWWSQLPLTIIKQKKGKGIYTKKTRRKVFFYITLMLNMLY